MDTAGTASTIAVTVSIIGALAAAYATLRQRKTEDATVVIQAMRDHMFTLTEDNKDLRSRVFTAEQHVVDLTAAVNRCETDKSRLETKLDELQRRFDSNS